MGVSGAGSREGEKSTRINVKNDNGEERFYKIGCVGWRSTLMSPVVIHR